MNKITIFRVIKAGFMNFWRNIWLSIATTTIMVLTLFMISVLLILNLLGATAIDIAETKVDVSVDFKDEVSESEILALKDRLEKRDEVRTVEYVSQEEALNRFKEWYKENTLIIQSLEEFEDIVLPASLKIQATEPTLYCDIVTFLEQEEYQDIIKKINYRGDREIIIGRLMNVTSVLRKVGLGVTGLLMVIAVLVMFNTIRLTIYSYRQEIEIMKLVGASNWYIRAPFIIEGMLYGVFACVITVLVLYPVLIWLSPYIDKFFNQEVNLIGQIQSRFFVNFLILLSTGVVLGMISSFIAIRRYLKV